MKTVSIIPSQHYGTWIVNRPITHDCDSHRDDAEKLVELCEPRLTLTMEKVRLNEATYKEIASFIDGTFLSQAIRAQELRGIKLAAINDNVLEFLVNSAEHVENRIQYRCFVQFLEWDETGNDTKYNATERARLLLWAGNIKLHCTCPSFLYWGYAWILSQLDAAIYPETRTPHIRNPHQRGVVCKHLNRVLRTLPFYSGDMAKAIRQQFGAD